MTRSVSGVRPEDCMTDESRCDPLVTVMLMTATMMIIRMAVIMLITMTTLMMMMTAERDKNTAIRHNNLDCLF